MRIARSTDTALTLTDLKRLLSSALRGRVTPEFVSDVVDAEGHLISSDELAQFGQLIYMFREKALSKGWDIPERFHTAPAKVKSKSVSDYSHEELVALIRPAFESFLASGGATA